MATGSEGFGIQSTGTCDGLDHYIADADLLVASGAYRKSLSIGGCQSRASRTSWPEDLWNMTVRQLAGAEAGLQLARATRSVFELVLPKRASKTLEPNRTGCRVQGRWLY